MVKLNSIEKMYLLSSSFTPSKTIEVLKSLKTVKNRVARVGLNETEKFKLNTALRKIKFKLLVKNKDKELLKISEMSDFLKNY